MSEHAYWNLELELADIAHQAGCTRAEMFEQPYRLSDKHRQRVACIILAQKKILKSMIKPILKLRVVK